jgi:hypothetical protein
LFFGTETEELMTLEAEDPDDELLDESSLFGAAAATGFANGSTFLWSEFLEGALDGSLEGGLEGPRETAGEDMGESQKVEEAFLGLSQ